MCGRKAFNLGCAAMDWTSTSSQPTGWRQCRVAGSCEYGTGVLGYTWARNFLTTWATVILPKWPYSMKLPLTLQLYYVFRHKSTVNASPNQRYTCPFQQHILILGSIPLHGLPPNQSREPPSVSTNPSPTPSLSSVKGKVTLLCIPALPSDG